MRSINGFFFFKKLLRHTRKPNLINRLVYRDRVIKRKDPDNQDKSGRWRSENWIFEAGNIYIANERDCDSIEINLR